MQNMDVLRQLWNKKPQNMLFHRGPQRSFPSFPPWVYRVSKKAPRSQSLAPCCSRLYLIKQTKPRACIGGPLAAICMWQLYSTWRAEWEFVLPAHFLALLRVRLWWSSRNINPEAVLTTAKYLIPYGNVKIKAIKCFNRLLISAPAIWSLPMSL